MRQSVLLSLLTAVAMPLLAGVESDLRRLRSKAEILKELTPLPKGLVGQLQVSKFQVKVTGDVAIATHEDLENLDYRGQKLVSRWRSTRSRPWRCSKIRPR